jgi:hypothetical protein
MRRRLAARLLDAVIVQIPASVVAIVLVLVLAASVEPTSSPAGVLFGIGGIFMALWLCLCAYEIVMIAVRGGTVGKLLLRITVVPVDTHVRYATHPHVPPAGGPRRRNMPAVCGRPGKPCRYHPTEVSGGHDR